MTLISAVETKVEKLGGQGQGGQGGRVGVVIVGWVWS